MLRSAERIPAVFVPPPKKRSCPNSRLVLRRRDRGCSQPRIHYYEYKNDCTWRSFARRWLLLVEPGFCTGRYGRNHDKRCIHGIRSRLRDNGRQKRSWHQPVALFRNQTDDETGAPVAIDRISPGSQLSIQYAGSGDQLVASRVIVRRAATATTAVTSVPAVTGQQTNTTTTTTRPLTHEEKHALKEEREHPGRAAKEEFEHQKRALEKAKNRLDDHD
jgi:hypothetical protein